jgi:hypothetical protein
MKTLINILKTYLLLSWVGGCTISALVETPGYNLSEFGTSSFLILTSWYLFDLFILGE